MQYKNSCMIVRTRKGNTVSCHMIATNNYIKLLPNKFIYKDGYVCNRFEILENVGGALVVHAYIKMKHMGIEIKNVIRIRNVTEIEMMSEHEL